MELEIIVSYAWAAYKSHATDYKRKIDWYTYDGKEWAVMVMTCSGAQVSSSRWHMKKFIRNSSFLKCLRTGMPRLHQFSQQDDEHISCQHFLLLFFHLRVLREPFIYLKSIQSLLDVLNILYVITFIWKFTHDKPKVSDRYCFFFFLTASAIITAFG